MDKKQLITVIGKNIYKYREKAGMTQAQLAEKVGMGAPSISRIERGEKSMKLYTLYSIAEALHISCDALLYPDSASAHLLTITRLLENQPEAYLEGVEEMIRTCNKHFFATPDDFSKNQEDEDERDAP